MNSCDSQGKPIEPTGSASEWLDALGDCEKVTRLLFKLQIGPTHAFPVFRRGLRRPTTLAPIGPWFAKLILEILEKLGIERIGAQELSLALIEHCDGRISKRLLTNSGIAALISRTGIRPRAGMINGKPRLIYERDSFVRFTYTRRAGSAARAQTGPEGIAQSRTRRA